MVLLAMGGAVLWFLGRLLVELFGGNPLRPRV